MTNFIIGFIVGIGVFILFFIAMVIGYWIKDQS